MSTRTKKDYRLSFVDAPHAHGCLRCHVRYEDTCSEPTEDGMCWLCWTDGERGLAWWPEGWLPRECCEERSVELDPESKRGLERLNQHALVGLHTWWRCMECARTFPYDPSKDYRPATTPAEWQERNRA